MICFVLLLHTEIEGKCGMQVDHWGGLRVFFPPPSKIIRDLPHLRPLFLRLCYIALADFEETDQLYQ